MLKIYLVKWSNASGDCENYCERVERAYISYRKARNYVKKLKQKLRKRGESHDVWIETIKIWDGESEI